MLGATLTQRRRSGIHRVTVECARALAALCDLDLVRFDSAAAVLRFVDATELDALFGPGAWPPGIRLRPDARRLGRPFRDQLEVGRDTWLLIPEVSWHEDHGVEILARVITACREMSVRTAAIFYDLIPVRNAIYGGGRASHEAYVAELVRSDHLVAISRTVGEELTDYWRVQGVSPTPPITSLLLPDGGFSRGAPAVASRASQPTIALIGTVEPRKRQLEFLHAMAAARARSTEVARRKVVLIGSMHPYVADAFDAFAARHGWVDYRDYASDAEVRAAIASADFTAFVSNDEGYGLPISESLAMGVPCLCADFGAMGEIAQAGGCMAVNVCDAAALEQAIVNLCETPQMLAELRGQIAKRPFRSWSDYANDLLGILASTPRPAQDGTVDLADPGSADLSRLDPDAFARIAGADVIAFRSADARRAFAAEAARRAWPALLPGPSPLDDPTAAAKRLAIQRAERARIAKIEAAYVTARSALPPDDRPRPIFLRLLISTHNRRDFVVANVRWLLKKVIGPQEDGVDLVVVDGASTDGTVKALQQIVDPRLTIIDNPADPGMLGSWREASHMLGAEYVWVVGDDDFIRPEGFHDILAGLKTNRGVPFAFMNFSVYHRETFSRDERAPFLIAESTPLARQTAPDGLIPVRTAAVQTDNLFTAIYAIVWRSDLWAATYDHAFDASPFSNLVEAIPCTELILGRYADCSAYWRGATTLAGNAHNSWSRWRARWHGVVMPMAFQLAREAGVDPVRLQTWADMHLKLFCESMAIARESAIDPALEPEQLALAELQFRVDLASEISK